MRPYRLGQAFFWFRKSTTDPEGNQELSTYLHARTVFYYLINPLFADIRLGGSTESVSARTLDSIFSSDVGLSTWQAALRSNVRE